MKAKTLIVFVIILAVLIGVFAAGRYLITRNSGTASKTVKDLYYCPMHPNFTSDKPGDCAICGMSLVKREVNPRESQKQVGERKILYYRNPMNPAVTSPVPMKDQMGMDYVPVYAEETAPVQTAGVYISTEKQQLIGVKKGKVQKRKLTGQILTVGKVAYDPALYTAQQEYLQTIKSNQSIQTSTESYIEKQSASLVKAARQKLLLLGMSDSEIDEMQKQGRPEQSLYLPGKEDKTVWVYVAIYENEASLIKTGTLIKVQTAAYPSEIFNGKIISIAPILESATRTLKARALVDNPENKLKLEMFVNVAINYDLGEKLAVPQEAVMHAGTRDIAFVAKPDGYFESRVVSLGAKAKDYCEVLQGLSENEEVVTSGNFLIDSESKLNAVLSKAAEANQ